MTTAKFKVLGHRMFNSQSEATVSIDRNNNLVTVRPHRLRKTYQMRLEDIASHVIWTILKSEMLERQKTRKQRKSR